jgi:hypothetical protein
VRLPRLETPDPPLDAVKWEEYRAGYLHSSIEMFGLLFHIDAVEVNDEGAAVNPDLQHTIDSMCDIDGDHTDGFETVTIRGKQYVLCLLPGMSGF